MISITVGGQVYEGWEEVSVARGLDRLAASFALRVSDRPWRIRPGQACQIAIDGERVLTGFVDGVRPSYDARRHELAVAGRSRTADLIDSSADHSPGQWDNSKIEDIARALAAPFGIAVVTETDTGTLRQTFSLDQGESVYEAIEELTRLRGVVATDNAAGDLVITRAGQARATTALVYGENILSANGGFSMAERHSAYTVKGQRTALDRDDETAVAQVLGTAKDTGVGRHRPLILTPSAWLDPETATRLARHEAAVRFGRSAEVVYTVRGWRQADGALWRDNILVRVEDPVMDLMRDMLIASLVYAYGAEGEVTELTLVRPEAFALLSGDDALPKDGGDQWADVVAAPAP